MSIVVELEECRTPLDLGLHHAGRRHFQHARRRKLCSKAVQDSGTHSQDGRGRLTPEHEVSVVGEDRWIRILRYAIHDCIVTAWCLTHTRPVVDNEFMVVWRRLALWQRFDHAIQLNRAFKRQCESIVRLDQRALQYTLQVARTITKHEEHTILLRTKAMNPATNLHTHVTVLYARTNFDALRRCRIGRRFNNDLLALLEFLPVLLSALRFLRGLFTRLLLLLYGHVIHLLGLLDA